MTRRFSLECRYERAVVSNLGILNELTYTGILPGQQRTICYVSSCVEELSRTHTPDPPHLMAVSIPGMETQPETRRISKQLDVSRRTARVLALRLPR